jgi:hypothetical protein
VIQSEEKDSTKFSFNLVPMVLVRLINVCLNQIYSEVHTSKTVVYNEFPIQNVLKKRRYFTAIDFQLCFRICSQVGSGKSGRNETELKASDPGLC